MGWIEKHQFWSATIVSIIVSIYAIMFHNYNYKVHNWTGVFLWLPVYLAPIWIIALLAYISDKRKEKKK